ncbi:TPA: transposase [Escherichia coli]|uniref:transposase n=1 Tax=Escherichia coli TaxID=562 RepID=UPI001F4964E9|nr:transposase [Escherichia coli]
MIKTRRTKRTFSPEFKLEAIEQVVKYQRDVREVALAPSSTLTICVNRYGCISRNFRVLSPLVMLLLLNNAKLSSLKRR